MIDEKQYYSPKQVAQRFAISLTKVYTLINTGKLGALDLFGSYRISDVHLSRFERRRELTTKQERKF